MTNEEAIIYIGRAKKGYSDIHFIKAFDKAIEALEKQIPKKVVYKFYDGDTFYDQFCDCYCPTCNANDSDITYDNIDGYAYCTNCGQALDWSEYEEKDNE